MVDQTARERPILFSALLVRAILDGTKTQTRRLVKAPGLSLDPTSHDYAVKADLVTEARRFGVVFFGDRGASRLVPCPYGQPGDRLWVKETHYRWGHWVKDGKTKMGRQRWRFKAAPVHKVAFLDERPAVASGREVLGWHKRPSLFMPRWASRITLEVTSVRVERLVAITGADARAEGVTDSRHDDIAIEHFAQLWNKINGERARFEDNPYVWVVGFKRVEALAAAVRP